MTIDVVVPTFENRAAVLRCLAAIEPQLGPDDRILVCVDGSTDGTQEALRARRTFARVVVLEHPDGANHGRAAARNLALSHLRAEHVLLLDSDMRVAPGALSAHVAALQSGAGVSVGAVRYTNGRSSDWARYAAATGRGDRPAGAPLPPLEFTSANALLRSADLLAVGGFDESLVGYGGEDTELGLRLARERGLRFCNTADAVAWTDETKAVDEALTQLDRYARTNLLAIRARHPGRPAPYWLDRLDSGGPDGRLLLALMNPLADAMARVALRLAPWPVRRRAIDYLVLRTVWRGYREGPR